MGREGENGTLKGEKINRRFIVMGVVMAQWSASVCHGVMGRRKG